MHGPAPDRDDAPARILFVGGSGHHYLSRLLDGGRAVGRCLTDPADPAASHGFARRHNMEQHDGSLAEAAADFAPDVVSVGAVYGLNGRYVIEALRLGLPVVSDKPIATDSGTLDEIELWATADDAPPLLTEFDWRSRPELRAARRALAAGQIGPLVLAVAQKSYRFGDRPDWYADERLYGGTMLWIASHGLDAIAFVCGEVPEVVHARGGNVSRQKYGLMEDHVTATLALPGGGTGLVHADLLNPAAWPTHGRDRLRLVGGRGELLVEEGRCTLTTDDSPPRDIAPEEPAAPPLAERLLSAALGESADADYNTTQSLDTARLMLAAAASL